MFQHFDTETDAGVGVADRIARLRAELAKRQLDALLVPRADCHQGEYVSASAERLRWLTGFSGSAGSAVIGRREAALFVDGRYTVQVRTQADPSIFSFHQLPEQTPAQWLVERLPVGANVGFDPWLHTMAQIEHMRKVVAARQLTLKRTTANLVDRVWGKERPHDPLGPVHVQPLALAGVGAADKIARVQSQLKADAQDAVVLTLPDSICWLLNIRGQDVAHNPVVLAFAIVPVRGKLELFIDARKVDDELQAYLAPVARLLSPDALRQRVQALRRAGHRVRVDHDSAAYAIVHALGPTSAVAGRDPCLLPKARKCAAEIKGARAAHLRDGVAVTRFLVWLSAHAEDGDVDEILATRRLEELRRETGQLRDISFDTIAGSGPNGAIVHYRVTENTNRRLRKGELFLVDSGAQYPDGTTDITRTIAIGKPSRAMRIRYTAVLKGHLAISMARFPVGTRGVDLDALARRALWNLGLDYDHGTGHGVGSYLSVHEGPASISKRGMVALEPGMILSNEPGNYQNGSYGIRIENLVLVEEPTLPAGGERPMLSFETLTLAPYDRRLIEVDALTANERAWLNAYHARVRRELGSHLTTQERRWLEATTAKL